MLIHYLNIIMKQVLNIDHAMELVLHVVQMGLQVITIVILVEELINFWMEQKIVWIQPLLIII